MPTGDYELSKVADGWRASAIICLKQPRQKISGESNGTQRATELERWDPQMKRLGT